MKIVADTITKAVDSVPIGKTYFDKTKRSENVEICEYMHTGTHQSIHQMSNLKIHINNEPLDM